MRKKGWMIAGGFALSAGIAAAVLIPGENEQPEPKKAPVVSQEEPDKAKQEIPEHSDNQQDLDQEVMQETKQIAEQFVSIMVPLNPKSKDDPREKIMPIVSKELFEELSKYPPARPTLTVYKRKINKMETYPVDDILPDRKKWNVIAFVTTSDNAGNEIQEEIWYWVSVAKRAGEWRVTGFEEGAGA